MYIYKKLINSDLLQLAILVSLLRLDLNSYLDGMWNNRLEANDIFLGTNIAYSQTRFNYLHNTINQYIHPKSIDAMLYERSSIFADLNSLGRYSRFQPLQSNVFAYLVDQEDHHIQEPPQHTLPDSSGNPAESANVDSRNDGTTDIRNETNPESHETSNVMTSPGSELSHEDMNLIEILWKQDIDLGLTKDAFDFRNSKEGTKPKQSKELLKPEKEPPKDVQPQPSAFDPWEGVSYIIDGETGEHIIQQSTINQFLPDIENCSLNDFDLERLAEELQNVPLDETLRLLNDECSDNQTNDLKKDVEYNNTFQGLEYENFSSNVALSDVASDDSLIEQLRELDSLIGKDTEGSECQVNGLYPNVGDGWQDLTAVLSLPSNLTSGQSSISQPRIAVNEPTLNNEIPQNISSLNVDFSDAFNNPLLQNTTLDPLGLSFPTTTGSSCISNPVSSSFAPFSNHTDPVSDNLMNVTYDHNFPNLFGPENTSNPDFLSNILFDEDLQLMDMSYAEGGSDISINKLVQDHKDASKDSALSSMDSDGSSSDDESMDYTSEIASSRGGHFETGSSASLSSPSSSSSSSSYASGGSTNSSDNYQSTAQKKYKLFGKRTLRFHDKNGNDNADEEKHENHKKNPRNPRHFSFEEQNMDDDYGRSFNSLKANSAIDKELDEQYNFNKPKDLSVTKNRNQNIHHNHTYNMPFESKNDNHKPVSRDKELDLDESGRDERRAQDLKIPISIHDIINLPIDEFNERVSRYDLNDAQLVLIRDIRRRGKNKVAAQNCRKRKIGQIISLQQELESLLEEKAALVAEQEEMLSCRRVVIDKYNRFYDFIKQSTSQDPQPPRPPDFLRQLALNERDKESSIPSNSTSLNGDDKGNCNKGARSKRKTDQK